MKCRGVLSQIRGRIWDFRRRRHVEELRDHLVLKGMKSAVQASGLCGLRISGICNVE